MAKIKVACFFLGHGVHLYSPETLMAQKKKKKTITIRTRKASNINKLSDSETIFNKTAPEVAYLTSNLLSRFGPRSLGKLKPKKL